MSAVLKSIFHSPEIMRLIMKRQKAISAVRKMYSNTGERAQQLGSGTSLSAYSKPGLDQVIKMPKSVMDNTAPREMKRRAMMKSVGADAGVAPETFLVDTKKNRYLVQDKLDNSKGWRHFEKPIPPEIQTGDDMFPSSPIPNMRYKLNQAGMTARDVHYQNLGLDVDGKIKMMDLGIEKMTRAMPETERRRALMRFIQKNRKKEWLG